jgi:hypothetical protein
MFVIVGSSVALFMIYVGNPLSVIAVAMPPPPKWEVLAEIAKFAVFARRSPFGRAGA